MWYIYIYIWEYYPIIKNEILLFVTTWMVLEGTMFSEISHTEKDKHCMTSLLCGILKRNQTNQNKMETDELTLTREECEKGGEG